MKLIDVVKKVKADGQFKKIKIGSTGGSSFFFVGTVDEFLNDVDKINRTTAEYNKQSLDNSEDTLRLARSYDTTYSAFENKEKARVAKLKEKNPKTYASIKPDLSDEHFELYLKRVKTRIKNLERTIANEKEVLNGPVLSEREVSYHFIAESCIDTDAIAILVRGYESGKYWMFSERYDGMPALKLSMDVAA